MMTYGWLSIVLIAVVLVLLFIARKYIVIKALLLTIVSIMLLTAVFDPLIITAGIVAYDPNKILAVYWLGAPIEDFSYAIAAPIAVVSLWGILGKIGPKKTS